MEEDLGPTRCGLHGVPNVCLWFRAPGGQNGLLPAPHSGCLPGSPAASRSFEPSMSRSLFTTSTRCVERSKARSIGDKVYRGWSLLPRVCGRGARSFARHPGWGVKLAKNLRPRGEREVLQAGGFPEGNGPEDEDSQIDEEVKQAAAGEQDAGLGAEEGEVSEPTEVLAEEAVEEGEDPVTEDGDPMDAEEEETEDAEVADAAEVAGGVGTEDAEAADAAEVAGGVGTEDAEGADAAEVAGEVGEEAAEEEPKEEDELTEAATSGEGPGRAPSVVSEGSSKWWTPTDFYSNLPYQRDGIWAEEESVLAAEIPGHVDYFAVGDRREVVDAQQDKQE